MTDFFDRMELAKRLVGGPAIEGQVEVNQVYAHYQDSGHGPHGMPAAAFNHPRGGEAGYLSDTLTRQAPVYAQQLADSLTELMPLDDKMARVTAELCDEVYVHAPREFWVLRNSAAGSVFVNGIKRWFRPSLIPRLSQAELNALRAASGEDILHREEWQHTSLYRKGRITDYLRKKRVTRSS